MTRLSRWTGRLGIDQAIGYSSMARIVQGIAGVIAILFVARFLSLQEQGFYFTFASLTALQMFFELGLNGIVVQYVAHEASHLRYEQGAWEGPENHRSRMASMLRFCLKWYSVMTLLFLACLLVLGYFFFISSPQTEQVNWKGPWALIVFGVSLNLFFSAFLSFLEGLGKVQDAARIRLFQQICASAVLLIGLWAGMGLYVTGANLLVGGGLTVFLLLKNYLPIYRSIRKITIRESIHYLHEIFPFQWKIAISWISGYLVIQLFNPILFRIEGAEIAGKMGMSLTVLLTIQALALNWIYTKVPRFSAHIARKEFKELDRLFFTTNRQMLTITGGMLLACIAGLAWIEWSGIRILGTNLAERFLPTLEICILALGIFLFTMVFSWASYLRCHKQEPMLPQAVTAGILCPLAAVLLTVWLGSLGACMAYGSVAILSVVMGKIIFDRKRNEWHQPDKA